MSQTTATHGCLHVYGYLRSASTTRTNRRCQLCFQAGVEPVYLYVCMYMGVCTSRYRSPRHIAELHDACTLNMHFLGVHRVACVHSRAYSQHAVQAFMCVCTYGSAYLSTFVHYNRFVAILHQFVIKTSSTIIDGGSSCSKHQRIAVHS